MTRAQATTDLHADIVDQAIAWLVKLRSGMLDAPSQARLLAEIAQWRQAAPEHDAAWLALQASEQGFDSLRNLPPEQALRTMHTVQQIRHARQGRRKVLRVLGLSVVGAGACVAMQRPVRDWAQGSLADYTTAIGERRMIALPDGTQIHLDTDTAIDVRYTDAQRVIVMHRGRMFIRTGGDIDHADVRRRFIVHAGATRLEALGTQFFVGRENDQTRLHVTEGRVAIRQVDATDDLIAMPGQSYQIDAAGRITMLYPLDQDAYAWLDGVLIAKQMRLSEVTAQLARYRRGWLRCDPAVADLRVSGVFQLDDTDRALASLVQALPIAMVSHTRYWVTLKPLPPV